MTANEENTFNLVCESCKREFSCGAEQGECWCFELKVPTDNLQKIQKDFQNCLCPICLFSYENKKEIPVEL